jgi:ABC-type transport system involved in cytochrome c biogenesis permease subunit
LALRLVLFVAGLFVGLRYMGLIEPAAEGPGYRLGAVLPRADLGASAPNLSVSLVWAASMFLAAMFVWYLPRVLPAALLAIPMALGLAGSAEGAERMERVYRWRSVALAGAVTSFFAALVAVHADFPKDIEALNPVLRSNFWLGIHVLTITTSYAAVGLAWVLGNLALGCFAFGRYRPVEGKRCPPAFCGTLAALNYRVLQVAVLLLAVGTITGGLWGDVSWGRFWGWDPKEVGALIALLIIMIALHGRRAGWHGDLTLAIGSVLGFGGVMWAWYVVNYILNAGLHSYGAGEGGQWVWLVVVAGVQLLYMAAAIARVMIETEPAAAVSDPSPARSGERSRAMRLG